MTLANALLAWYAINGRSLPWRQHRDPYRIWISEIMLQQTQVVSVSPYYGRWMARFPDLKSLAIADMQEVLHHWQGLGYYQRAKNLHRTAQILWHTHHGEMPREVQELRQLPGIGAYTAGAIAAIAYNQPQPAIDGNVRRILCRLFLVSTPSGRGDRQLEDYYRQIMPPERNRDFLQALMDLGALICTAKAPQCFQCPIAPHCQAHHQGLADQLPHKPARSPIPTRTAIALVHRTATHTLLQQAPDHGLLAQLWAWPQTEPDPSPVPPWQFRGTFRHRYTHFRQVLHVYERVYAEDSLPVLPTNPSETWQPISRLSQVPMGTLARRIANTLFCPTS